MQERLLMSLSIVLKVLLFIVMASITLFLIDRLRNIPKKAKEILQHTTAPVVTYTARIEAVMWILIAVSVLLTMGAMIEEPQEAKSTIYLFGGISALIYLMYLYIVFLMYITKWSYERQKKRK